LDRDSEFPRKVGGARERLIQLRWISHASPLTARPFLPSLDENGPGSSVPAGARRNYSLESRLAAFDPRQRLPLARAFREIPSGEAEEEDYCGVSADPLGVNIYPRRLFQYPLSTPDDDASVPRFLRALVAGPQQPIYRVPEENLNHEILRVLRERKAKRSCGGSAAPYGAARACISLSSVCPRVGVKRTGG